MPITQVFTFDKAIWLLGIAFWVWMLIDCIRYNEERGFGFGFLLFCRFPGILFISLYVGFPVAMCQG